MTDPRPLEHHERVEVVREFVTMGLYVSLSLLAVVLAVPTDSTISPMTVVVTALALVLAHLVAFSISSRLVNHGEVGADAARLLGVQAAAGLLVAAVAAVPVLLLPTPADLVVTSLVLLVIVGVVGYLAARESGAGRGRALIYVAGLAVVVAVVLLLKSLVH